MPTMKKSCLYTILVLAINFTIFSCKEDSKSTKTENLKVETNDSLNAAKQNAIIDFYKNASTASVSSVFHYTCPKGCPGGAGAAGNCSTCGTSLVHNAAFHNKPNNNSAFSNSANSNATSPTNTNTANNARVFHYICESGCAGGSGSAGNCSTCGNALAHNAAFHNN